MNGSNNSQAMAGQNASAASSSTKKSKSSSGDKGKKAKKLLRMAGGTVWEDNTLQEWDPDDFRIFCGDLGNDVTDDVLARAFNRFPSFIKAKVIRDKRSNKSRGYGFVSFKDPQDFTRAIKEMNGLFILLLLITTVETDLVFEFRRVYSLFPTPSICYYKYWCILAKQECLIWS